METRHTGATAGADAEKNAIESTRESEIESARDSEIESTRDSAQQDIREAWKHRVVLGDGAMATMLHQSGVPIRTCYEELSVSHPNWVRDVHLAYIAAGAEVIQTNTFGAHRIGLERYGLAHQLSDMNRAAVAVAREAARIAQTTGALSTPGDPPRRTKPGIPWVFGTIGSTADLGYHSEAEDAPFTLKDVFREQLDVLLSAGVDGILLETFADLEEMLLALDVVRGRTPLPIIATLSPDAPDVTRDGVPLTEAFAAMKAAGADVVGLNCRLGLAGILRSYERLPHHHDTVYAAVPNAGLLHLTEGEVTYTAGAEYFADMGQRLVENGVRFVGGCCGTTPRHIRKLAERIGGLAGHDLNVSNLPTSVDAARLSSLRVTFESKSIPSIEVNDGMESTPTLLEKVQKGTTVIVELDPPRTTDISRYMAGARALHAAGADSITLADNSLGTVRVSNMAVAAMLKPLGIDPLVHVTCRDRNLIGQQSHLMGLNVLGIHHILLVTGDPSRFGDLPGATSVYDVSSIELTRMVRRLNEGIAFSGQPLKQPAKFVVGTSFNPHVRNFDKAIDRLKRKVDAGADYIMTQPVYDERIMEEIARNTEGMGIPVFIGIMPLVSARNALFLHNEVPGMHIPATVLEQMVDAPLETATEVGMSVAADLTVKAGQYFNGIYLMTPFLRYDLTARLTAAAKAGTASSVQP